MSNERSDELKREIQLTTEAALRGEGALSPQQVHDEIFFTSDDLKDPRNKALAELFYKAGKQDAGKERDDYRNLLEARINGLEAMLTAFVRQTEPSEWDSHPKVNRDLWDKASNYLFGKGHL